MSFRHLFLLSSVSHVLHLSLDLHHMIFHIRAGLVGLNWGQKLETNISKEKIWGKFWILGSKKEGFRLHLQHT